MQYSMRTLLLAATAAAIVCICMVYPEPITGDLVYTAGLLLIGLAAIGAIYFTGQRRAFLIGFLIFFGGYYYVSVAQSEMRMAMAFVRQTGGMPYTLGSGLITTRFLAYAYETLHSPSGGVLTSFRTRPSPSPDKIVGGYVAFLVVGHTVFAFGLGILGGRIAQHLSGRMTPLVKRPLEDVLKEMRRE